MRALEASLEQVRGPRGRKRKALSGAAADGNGDLSPPAGHLWWGRWGRRGQGEWDIRETQHDGEPVAAAKQGLTAGKGRPAGAGGKSAAKGSPAKSGKSRRSD